MTNEVVIKLQVELVPPQGGEPTDDGLIRVSFDERLLREWYAEALEADAAVPMWETWRADMRRGLLEEVVEFFAGARATTVEVVQW